WRCHGGGEYYGCRRAAAKVPTLALARGVLAPCCLQAGAPARARGTMVRVHFTSHLRHVAPDGAVEAKGATVAGALADVFARHPTVKSYVLDDQDRLRTHIAVFVDGTHIRKDILAHPLRDDSEIYVLQALSGG